MRIDRREFLGGVVSFAGGFVGSRPAVKYFTGRNEKEGMQYRLLGKTGMSVSIVGMGAMQCSDPDILRYAVSLGINYVDTADCYMGGQNEKIVGRALAGIREKVFLATKVHVAGEERMVESIERSLRSLRTDRVDLMQLHGLSSKGEVFDERAKNVIARMKKEGKVRFAGVTTHSNQLRVLGAVLEDGFYDTVLIAFNFRSPRRFLDVIGRAGTAGVGIIAMKTQNGGYGGTPYPGLTPHQAALRYVLDVPGVSTAIPGMYRKSMIDENIAVVGPGGGILNSLLLESHGRELAGKACSFCSRCIDECRYGAGGIDSVRLGMYINGYDDLSLARQACTMPSVRENLLRCADCPSCTVLCSGGMDIRSAAGYVLRCLTGDAAG